MNITLLRALEIWGAKLCLTMEYSPSWESNSCPASQEIPRLLWNRNVHYRIYKSLRLVSILSQVNSVHTFPPYFPKVHSDIILPYL
jgi:hypothetical protein